MQIVLKKVEVKENDNCDGCVFLNTEKGRRGCDIAKGSVKLAHEMFSCNDFDSDGKVVRSYIWTKE